MKSHLYLALFGALCFAGSAYAQPPGWYGHPPRQDTHPVAGPAEQAAATLRQGLDAMREFLDQEDTPNKLQTAAFLDREIAPYFDFDYMARWIAGPAYGRMDDEAKEALAAKVEASFLGTLAKQLGGYKNRKVRILRPHRGPRNSVNVRAEILQPGTRPAKLGFRMYQSDDGWKVYDVSANGRSVSTYYRNHFRQSIAPRTPIARRASPQQ